MQLGIPEKKFWRMTQRKFDILWKRHVDFNRPPSKPKEENKSENKREIGENEKAFIDDIDFF